ncbi:MAG: V-type ATP synthase subunit I [Fretibacterium sp.]|nr:V-type ATP synthase subunit I [Fretibacterium sp.]
MGVAKLKKAELYYHKSVREEIAEVLQDSGVCQIIEDPEREARPTEIEACLAESEERLSDIRYLLRTLSGRYRDPIPSIDRLLGERPVVSMANLSRLARETDLAGVSATVRQKEHEINELRAEASQLRTNQSLLDSLGFFPHSLSLLTEGTRTVRGIAGTVKAEQFEAFRRALAEFAQDTELILPKDIPAARDVPVVVLLSRDRSDKIIETCTRNGMSISDIPPLFKGTVTEESVALVSKLAELELWERTLSEELDALAERWMPIVQKLSDYWNSLAGRHRALGESDETDRTLRTRFWVPEREAAELQKRIEAVSPSVALFLSDPAEGDEPPALLENGRFVRPFNVLTTLYSPPVYGGTDPTPLLAPFFFIFFGMCLGDAGYALVMLGLIAWLFKKYRRIPSSVKDFIVLFAFCAVSTFVYGILSGSFFGDFVDAFLPFLIPVKKALMAVDPMTNPMQVLGISLILGVVHLMFGLGIAAYDNIRNGRCIDAVGGNIAWIFFITGLCLFGSAAGGFLPSFFSPLGKIMAAAGALVIFWYAGREKKNVLSKALSGFLALYGSTSYLGDILSYSRLLALGFGSAVIGMIINLLGGMSAEIPYVGWLVAIVVLVGGHLFSILINILGAFVHPLRLQYVEFFGKFYPGGGLSYAPLTHSEEYVEIDNSCSSKV